MLLLGWWKERERESTLLAFHCSQSNFYTTYYDYNFITLSLMILMMI